MASWLDAATDEEKLAMCNRLIASRSKKIGQLMLEVCGLRILFIIRLQDFRRKSSLDPAQIRPQLSASGCISPENLLDVDL